MGKHVKKVAKVAKPAHMTATSMKTRVLPEYVNSRNKKSVSKKLAYAANEKVPVAERAAKAQAKAAARNAHVTINASEKTHKAHYPENEKGQKAMAHATKRLNNQLKWSTNQFHVPKPKAKK